MELGVSYFGNRIPQHYGERDLPEIIAHGCTYVVHTFSEEDLRFYRGAVREMVEQTHQAGLKVYLDPWGVGGVFGGEAFSAFLLENLDAWQVTAAGVPVPRACLRTPAFREFMRQWTDASISLGADVIFWDEPHLSLPGVEATQDLELTCWCSLCREGYRERYNEAMPELLTARVVEFREDTIVGFLEEMCGQVSRRGLRNAVCLAAFEDAAQGVVNWERVACIQGLDILGVTPFWQLYDQNAAEFVGRWATEVAALCVAFGKEPQVWLQGFLIGVGREGEVVQAAEAATQAGVRNLAAWGFEGCGHLGALRSERPEEVWRLIGETFNQLRMRE